MRFHEYVIEKQIFVKTKLCSGTLLRIFQENTFLHSKIVMEISIGKWKFSYFSMENGKDAQRYDSMWFPCFASLKIYLNWIST